MTSVYTLDCKCSNVVWSTKANELWMFSEMRLCGQNKRSLKHFRFNVLCLFGVYGLLMLCTSDGLVVSSNRMSHKQWSTRLRSTRSRRTNHASLYIKRSSLLICCCSRSLGSGVSLYQRVTTTHLSTRNPFVSGTMAWKSSRLDDDSLSISVYLDEAHARLTLDYVYGCCVMLHQPV